jgi:hypothetical protein
MASVEVVLTWTVYAQFSRSSHRLLLQLWILRATSLRSLKEPCHGQVIREIAHLLHYRLLKLAAGQHSLSSAVASAGVALRPHGLGTGAAGRFPCSATSGSTPVTRLIPLVLALPPLVSLTVPAISADADDFSSLQEFQKRLASLRELEGGAILATSKAVQVGAAFAAALDESVGEFSTRSAD